MTTAYAIGLVDEINSRLEAQAVLEHIDFHAEKVQQAGDTIKAFCPIHKDSRFRSVLVDAERHAFRCTVKTCAGYAGGSLVELYALSCDLPLLQAACRLAETLQVTLEEGWLEGLVSSYLEEANAARERGDFTEAQTLLREAATIAPGMLEPRMMLAMLYDDLGNSQEAAEEFVRLVDDRLASGHTDEAVTLISNALNRFPQNEDLLFASIRVAEATADKDLAIARMEEIITMREADNRQMDNIGLLEQLVIRAPDRPDLAIKLGNLYEQQHNVRGASRQYEAAANHFVQSGEAVQAVQWLEKVVQFNSENNRARAQLVELLLQVGEKDKARDHTFRIINQHIDQQEFGPAVATVNSWLQTEPDSVPARELLARTFLEQERTSEAAAYLSEGATISAKAGDHATAADLLLRAKYLTPDAVELRRQLITEFTAVGDHQRAAFERIDLAEILFGADEKQASAETLVAGIQSEISIGLKLQMLTSLVNHDERQTATDHLAGLQAELDTASPEAQAEYYELRSRLDPAYAGNYIALVNSLWEVAPGRAVDSAADGVAALLDQENTDGATALLDNVATRLDNYVPEAARLLPLAARAGCTDLAGTIYQMLIQGLADEDPEQALGVARWMWNADPQHPSAASDIAYLLAALGKSAEAAAQYAVVADLLLQGGDYESGLQYAREATALDAESVPALAVQARLAQHILPADEALEAAQDLLKALPQANTAESATAGYTAAIELFPNDEMLMERAVAALRALDQQAVAAQIAARHAALIGGRGDWAAAANKLSTAVEIAPGIPENWEQYGEALKITGDKDHAAAAFAESALVYRSAGLIEDAARCVSSAEIMQATAPASLEKLFAAADAVGNNQAATTAAAKLAGHFARDGQPGVSVRWAREWMRLEPDSPDANAALGRALVSVNQPEAAAEPLSTAAQTYFHQKEFNDAIEAIDTLVKSRQVSEDDIALLEKIAHSASDKELTDRAMLLAGNALLASGDAQRAAKIAEKASGGVAVVLWPRIARATTDAAEATSAWLHAGEAMRAGGDHAGAVAVLQEALAARISDFRIHSLLADILGENSPGEALPHQLEVLRHSSTEGNDKALQKLLKQLRKTYGKSAHALTQIAQVLIETKQQHVALQDLEAAAALALAENDTPALITICGMDEDLTRSSAVLTRARADALMGAENEQQALEWVADSARNLAGEGKFAEALEMAERWMNLRPRDVEARRLFAMVCSKTGRQQDADATNLRTADIVLKAGDFATATEILNELLSRDPDNIDALRLMIESQKRSSDTAGATQSICRLAELLERAGDIEAALAAYGQCVALDPNATNALWKQAELTRFVEDDRAALPLYRRWLQIREESADAEQWIDDLQRVAEILPGSSAVLQKLTAALTGAGRVSEAMPYLEKLRQSLEAEGDFAGAAETLSSIIGLAAMPDPALHLEVSHLYEKASSPSRAQDHLRAAAALFEQTADFEQTVAALDKVIQLSGDNPLPEDFAKAAAAHAHNGNRERAQQLIKEALQTVDSQTGNRDRKEKLLALALEIDPLNAVYATQHMEQLPPGRAMAEGLRAAAGMQAAGHHDDAIQVLTQVVALAPHDMSVRQQLFEPLRASGNKIRLRQELMLLASDALSAGDSDAALDALDEAESLAETAQQYRALAELNERARRVDHAAAQFAQAALAFAEVGKTDQAITSINRAMSARPAAVPAEMMAELVDRIGEPVYDIAREQLRTALTARRQKQSQILALALMACSPARANEMLRTVHTLGGNSILTGISYVRINHLLEQKDVASALSLANSLLEIAPDSSEVWHLYAQASNSAGNTQDAVRAALEAARLYAIAGAVMEEEDSYAEALSASPGDPIVLSAYAEFLIREHRPNDALEQLQTIVRAAEAEGNIDAQIEALNRAVQVAPGNADVREKLAKLLEPIAPDSAIENWLHTAAAYQDSGQNDRARRTYQHVLSLNPRNETALHQLMQASREDADLVLAAKLTMRLAEVKAARRNIGEACRILQTHLEIDPENLEVLEQLSALAGQSNDNEVFTTTTRALARKFQKMGDNVAALRHYQALLDRNPRDVQLLTTILDCCAASGNSQAGLEYARQLLNVARETEDPERIRVAAATIINYEESDADARRELAESLLSLNRVPAAVTEFLRAAEFYEGAGSNANAFNCYRRATQINPGSSQAWRRLADLSLTMGDLETARRSVSQLLETATPSDAGRLIPLLDRLLQTASEAQDVHQAAMGFYRRIGNNVAAAAEAAWLAGYAAQAGQNEEAEALFAEALKLDPANRQIKVTHYDFIRQLGRLEDLQIRLRQEADQHLADGNTDEAIVIFYELGATAPGQVTVHRDLARLLENAERFDESLQQYLAVMRMLMERSELEDARETAESVVARFPESANARELVADVLADSAYPDLAARYYSTAAEKATAEKNHDQAIRLLKKAVNARPLWVGARTALATAYTAAGKDEEAFQASIELVSVLLENGEFLEATSTLNRLSAEHPDSLQVREKLAGLYEKTGRRADYIRVLRDLAEIYEKANDKVQAAAAYHRLSQADPDDPTAISRYVELATALGESDGKFADEYTRLAEVLARSGDMEGAFQAYEQVLAQAPENTSARSRYAAFLLARGNRNRALSEMRTLANLYLHRNEPAAAAEVLNAALTISPRDAELCLELAKAQESAGMVEDARVSYSRASAILANTAAVKGIDTYRRILSIDENNTAVRLRMVELLMKAGDTMEAAREARTLAEIHINRGELAEAEHAYALIDQCEPQSLNEIREAIQRDSYDPSLQYLHYVRLGNCLFSTGDIDNALDAYRTARSLHDDQVELIQKCIDCLALIAPEAEAIPDYLVMAEKYLLAGQMQQARMAYEKVRMVDPFNNDARCGIESVNAAEARQNAASGAKLQDEVILKTSRTINKRVALMDLLVACQEAADEQSADSGRLGMATPQK